MSTNREAVIFSIKEVIAEIHTDGYGGLFNNKVVKAPIHSVPEEYKILYKDIPIDIDQIGNLLAYYHYNINKYLEIFTSGEDEITFASDKSNLLFFAEKSHKLIQMLGSIGYPLRFIKYKSELKAAKNIKSRKFNVEISNYEPIFGIPEDSHIHVQSTEKVMQASAREHARKCREKIKNGDYSGSITNSRSLVESSIKDIYKEITDKDIDPRGDLTDHWRKLVKELNMHPVKAPSDDLKIVMGGLFSIINGLSAVRNKMSDAHGNAYKAEKHHAILAAKTAFTIVKFIYDVHNHQEQSKLIPSKKINPFPPTPF